MKIQVVAILCCLVAFQVEAGRGENERSKRFYPGYSGSGSGNRLDGTCDGFCGGASNGGCYCDNACHGWDDCCDDKVHFCGEEHETEDNMMSTTYMPSGDYKMPSTYMPSGNGNDGTCDGHCGGSAPGGCHCDNACHTYDDCCDDKVDVCGEEEPTSGSGSGDGNDGTCDGHCGGSAPGGCHCDNACHTYDDCCDDKVDVCGEEEPPWGSGSGFVFRRRNVVRH